MTDLQELADRLEIADLLARYCDALDSRRWHLLATVFTPDARCDYGSVGTPTGVEAITAAVRSTLQDLDATQHLVGSVQVRLHGDIATSRCALFSQHVRGDALYTIGGRYDDELLRTPEGWRIHRRRLQRLWSAGDRDVVRRRG